MGWEHRTLSEFLRIKHGFAFKSQFFSNEGEYVLLTPGNFYERGGFKNKGEKETYYTGDIPEDFILKKRDLLVAMTEQMEGLLGSPALIPADDRYLHNQRLGLVSDLDENLLDKGFLYHLFNTHNVRHQISASASGTKVRHTSPERIGKVRFHCPPITTQRRIASILSAYDDLIENNLRRIALLEESARLLYNEWFVRLRFPGYEHTRIVNGVPEGWETHVLSNLCHIGRGASPRPIAVFMSGEIPWFKIGDATASESFFIFETKEHVTDEGAKKSIILDPGAVILSNSATCGIPYFTAVRGCVHDGWLHFSAFKRISEQILYWFLYFKREQLVSSVGDGSTQKNLNTAAVGRLKISLPRSDALLTQFEEAVAPSFSMVLNLATQNLRLREARDLLLPRLMSGEIEV